MGGVGHESASKRAGEMERMRDFVGFSEVVVLVFGFGFGSVFDGAEVVRGRRREDINVRMNMLRGLRRCILGEGFGAH